MRKQNPSQHIAPGEHLIIGNLDPRGTDTAWFEISDLLDGAAGATIDFDLRADASTHSRQVKTGDTFEVGDQVWRLDEVHRVEAHDDARSDTGRCWARITRMT